MFLFLPAFLIVERNSLFGLKKVLSVKPGKATIFSMNMSLQSAFLCGLLNYTLTPDSADLTPDSVLIGSCHR